MADDADDSRCAPNIDNHRLADRILIWKISPREDAINYDYLRGFDGIVRVKKTSFKKRNSHRLQIIRARPKHQQSRSFRCRSKFLRARPERSAVILLAERNNICKVGRLDSGNFANALDQLTIGDADVRRICIHRRRKSNLECDDVLRVEPEIDIPKMVNGAEKKTGANEQHKRQRHLNDNEGALGAMMSAGRLAARILQNTLYI